MATTARSGGVASGSGSGTLPGRKPRPPRKQAAATKESPIAFRPRSGTRAQLQRRAGGRSLSAVVEQAVDAYLGRQVREVDPALREAVATELGQVRDLLQDLLLQQAGIGRNVNQVARFVNSYKETPIDLDDALVDAARSSQVVIDALKGVHARLDRLATAGATTAARGAA